MCWTKTWPKTYVGAELAQNRFGLSMAKTPMTTFFDHIDGLEFFLIFLVPNLNYLPLLQEGTTAEFQALSSSHNCPCMLAACMP